MATPADFLETLQRFLETPILFLAAFLLLFLGYLFFEAMIPPSNGNRKHRVNRFRVGNAVVAYKGADLTVDGFKGVSGGGSYGHLEEGMLNPGFHALKSIQDLRNSAYGIGANVYLEVLLYGDVIEYERGYIGSHQRVLQVIVPDNNSMSCYRCYHRKPKYFDTRRSSISPGEMEGPLICEGCKRGSRMRSWTLGKASLNIYRDDPKRFIPLAEYFEARNQRSSNPQPICFASSLEELMPTVLPDSVSAR